MSFLAIRPLWTEPKHIILTYFILLVAMEILALTSQLAESLLIVRTISILLRSTSLTCLRMPINAIATLLLSQTNSHFRVCLAYWDLVFDNSMDKRAFLLGILAVSLQVVHTDDSLDLWIVPGTCDSVKCLLNTIYADNIFNVRWRCWSVVTLIVHF